MQLERHNRRRRNELSDSPKRGSGPATRQPCTVKGPASPGESSDPPPPAQMEQQCLAGQLQAQFAAGHSVPAELAGPSAGFQMQAMLHQQQASAAMSAAAASTQRQPSGPFKDFLQLVLGEEGGGLDDDSLAAALVQPTQPHQHQHQQQQPPYAAANVPHAPAGWRCGAQGQPPAVLPQGQAQPMHQLQQVDLLQMHQMQAGRSMHMSMAGSSALAAEHMSMAGSSPMPQYQQQRVASAGWMPWLSPPAASPICGHSPGVHGLAAAGQWDSMQQQQQQQQWAPQLTQQALPHGPHCPSPTLPELLAAVDAEMPSRIALPPDNRAAASACPGMLGGGSHSSDGQHAWGGGGGRWAEMPLAPPLQGTHKSWPALQPLRLHGTASAAGMYAAVQQQQQQQQVVLNGVEQYGSLGPPQLPAGGQLAYMEQRAGAVPRAVSPAVISGAGVPGLPTIFAAATATPLFDSHGGALHGGHPCAEDRLHCGALQPRYSFIQATAHNYATIEVCCGKGRPAWCTLPPIARSIGSALLHCEPLFKASMFCIAAAYTLAGCAPAAGVCLAGCTTPPFISCLQGQAGTPEDGSSESLVRNWSDGGRLPSGQAQPSLGASSGGAAPALAWQPMEDVPSPYGAAWLL